MKEIAAILDAWDDSHILATVVAVRGSAYRRPGARMLVLPDASRVGSVSGGCLESDVAKKAWWYTAGNKPVVRTYDSQDFGMGCNGAVDILLERLNTPKAHRGMRFLEDRRASREPGVIATVIRGRGIGDRLYVAKGSVWANDIEDLGLCSVLLEQAAEVTHRQESKIYSSEDYDVFVEWLPPPLPLLIFGAGHDVAPLVAIAKEIGWHVTVAAPRPAKFPRADQVVLLPADDLTYGVDLRPETAIVLMTHSVDNDRELLQRLLPLHPRYLGMLGPRSRTERLLEEIGGHLDVSELHAPIGLDIGADTPETIALAVVAEIQAAIRRRSGCMLKKRVLTAMDLDHVAGD
jgi:xanthine/CO dehydrogenase XdhC/CoxF family maturation factor